MKFTIGTVSNFQDYRNDLKLIKSSLLYADEIELIGMTEYAVYKYLPRVLDSQKDLDEFIAGLLPLLDTVFRCGCVSMGARACRDFSVCCWLYRRCLLYLLELNG